MDRQILILIIVVNLIAGSIFAYKKAYAVNEKTYIEISLPKTSECGTKIPYSDKTKGAESWLWDFGDGEYSNTQSGEHSYLEPNTYNVKLTVMGAFGVIKDSMNSITVQLSNAEATQKVSLPAIAEPKVAPAPATAPKVEVKKQRKSGNSDYQLPDDKGAQEIEE